MCSSAEDASRARINDMLDVCLAHRDAEHAIGVPRCLFHAVRIVKRDRLLTPIAKVEEECVCRLQ